jgi:hypothetical protein
MIVTAVLAFWLSGSGHVLSAHAAAGQVVPVSAGDAWSACYSGCFGSCWSASYADEIEVSEEMRAACNEPADAAADEVDACIRAEYRSACTQTCAQSSCAHLREGDGGFDY